MITFPIHYCPPGMKRPAHLRAQGGSALTRPVGPADASSEERQGTIYGESGWSDQLAGMLRRTRAGWWVAMGDAEPMHFARLSPVDGEIIAGVRPGHLWMVPKLLALRPGVGLVSAVPSEFRDYRWQPPEHLAPVMERLRSLLLWTPDGEIPAVPDERTIEIAVEVLAVNYHLTIHEMTVAGWISDVFVLDVLRAAAGLPRSAATGEG